MGNEKVFINKLLFYIQIKIHVISKDEIIERCVKFYTLDEVKTGAKTLESALDTRLSKRNKADDLQLKLLSDLYDKIWSLDSSNTNVPRFLASDLARIPREIENSDSLATTEQLLSSICNLKSVVMFLQQKIVTR